MLRTCSAPVCRSQLSEDNLPLDLHVLSLPLAFILSQDQTLHCKKCKSLDPCLISQTNLEKDRYFICLATIVFVLRLNYRCFHLATKQLHLT